MSGALENLKSCQGQVDADGVWVAVSRQALEETFVFIDGLQERIAELERVAAYAAELEESEDVTRSQWRELRCRLIAAGYLKEQGE